MIPVNAGCEYSTNGREWTVIKDGDSVPTPFTGWVKFNSVVSGSGYTDKEEVFEPEVLKTDDITVKNSSDYGYDIVATLSNVFVICQNNINVFDLNGNKLASPEFATSDVQAFVLNDTAYFIGSGWLCSLNADGTVRKIVYLNLSSSFGYFNFVLTLKNKIFIGDNNSANVFYLDSNFNKTTASPLMNKRCRDLSYFVLGDYIHICGGKTQSNNTDGTNYHDIFDENGVGTTGESFPVKQFGGTAVTFGDKAYVCGVRPGFNTISAKTYILDSNGTWTTGTDLSIARSELCGIVLNNKMYIIGGNEDRSEESGAISSSVIDIYDVNGNRSNNISLKYPRYRFKPFCANYVCATSGKIFIGTGYKGPSNSNPVRTTEIIEPKNKYTYQLKVPVTEFTDYFIDGEEAIGTADEVKTFTKESKGMVDPEYSWDYIFKYENGNISI